MAQIGTVRLETQNSGVVDVPVFEPGDSASGIYEFVRVETASGPGFIPVTDPADATYPYLRVQSQNNGVVAVTDTPGSDIPDGAIHRYQFESGVTDSIGGANGTNNGGSFVNNSIEGAEAIEFESANNDNVDITTISPSGFSDDAWSVSAWVNFNSLSDFARIVAGTDIQSGSSAWGLFLNNDTSQKLSVVTYNGSFTSAESSVSPTLGQWYHLVGTYDGSSLKLYVDGAEEASLTTAEGTISEDVAHIGSDNDTAYMNGLVDDVILFNRPLPSTDVSQLYSIY